jgi:hypothetical protein
MCIISCGRYRSPVLANPGIQNRNVHPRLGPMKFFRKGLHHLKALHIDLHNLDLSRLKLFPNLLSSGFALLHVPHPKDHPRLMFRIQSGGLEAYSGVGTGDEDRLPREVDICWDLWDCRHELLEAEGERSIRVK